MIQLIRKCYPKGLPAVADFALNPPKWQAASSRNVAELTFCVGGMFAQDRWNDTLSAAGWAIATAMQFVHVVALCAVVLSMGWDVAIGIVNPWKRIIPDT